MSNKKCIIIHGCPSDVKKAMNLETRTYDKHWIPWLKQNPIASGIKTETPLMPDPWEPNYQKFKAEFEKYSVVENTILVGHSCGCAFLVKWLGETKRKISKLILVAPWKIPDKDDDFRKEFYIWNIINRINHFFERDIDELLYSLFLDIKFLDKSVLFEKFQDTYLKIRKRNSRP